MTNKRRVIDRLVLVAVIVRDQNLSVKKRPMKGQQLSAIVQLQKSISRLVENPPYKLVQAFESMVGISANMIDEETKEEFFKVSVRVSGLFGVPEGDPFPPDAVANESHSLARLIYPVARAELSRMLGGSKFLDLPLSWDIGPESDFPTNEPSAQKSTNDITKNGARVSRGKTKARARPK